MVTIITFIIGLLIGYMLGRLFIFDNKVYHGPNSDEIRQLYFMYKNIDENDHSSDMNKCYKFVPVPQVTLSRS